MNLELTLDREELALTILHMNIMRKSVKRGFKSNYGLLDGRKKTKLYDQVKDKLSENLDEETDIFLFDFAADEIDMLSSFMNFYVQELNLSAEIEGFNAGQNETLAILEKVKEKVCSLDELVTDEVLKQCQQ